MPQLPSGRHVGISADHALAIARQGDFALSARFTMTVKTPDDLAPFINIIYYRPVENRSSPGEPYVSDLFLSDIGTKRCNWSDEDVNAFRVWIQSSQAQDWMHRTFEELSKYIRAVKSSLPENLRGILDVD